MRRGLSQPPRRGQSRVTAAKNSPIAKNSSKYVSGTNQTKCRLIRYRRLVGLMLRHKIASPPRATRQPGRTRLTAEHVPRADSPRPPPWGGARCGRLRIRRGRPAHPVVLTATSREIKGFSTHRIGANTNSSGFLAVTVLPEESGIRFQLLETLAKPLQDRLHGLDPRLIVNLVGIVAFVEEFLGSITLVADVNESPSARETSGPRWAGDRP